MQQARDFGAGCASRGRPLQRQRLGVVGSVPIVLWRGAGDWLYVAGCELALFSLIIPPQMTSQAAASSSTSQRFMLIGFAVLIPVTLVYNTFGFRVFSGKIHPVED